MALELLGKSQHGKSGIHLAEHTNRSCHALKHDERRKLYLILSSGNEPLNKYLEARIEVHAIQSRISS